MSDKEKKTRNKKRRSDSDGVTVKRSYYSFAKYYPGGGSSQKYRRVMKETKDEKKPIKIAFAALGLMVVAFIGWFMTTVALDVSYAPTTEPTQTVTQEPEETTLPAVIETTKHKEEKTTQKETSETATIEEPEREVNVTVPTSYTEAMTTLSQESMAEGTTEEVTEVFTGY